MNKVSGVLFKLVCWFVRTLDRTLNAVSLKGHQEQRTTSADQSKFGDLVDSPGARGSGDAREYVPKIPVNKEIRNGEKMMSL